MRALRRITGAAHTPERTVNFLAPLDLRTLLYVARADDWSGPWLWALDVETQGHAPRDHGPRAIHLGVGQPRRPPRGRDRGQSHDQPVARATARSARRGTRRGTLPCADRTGAGPTLRRDVALLSIAFCAWDRRRALAGIRTGRRSKCGRAPTASCPSPPRCRRTAAAWRSSSDNRGSGTWRSCLQTAPTHEPWHRPSRSRASAGQGTADWSPDGAWIVTGGSDEQGKGLFKIPVDGGGEPVRLLTGDARGPVWSPKGDLIVYASPRDTGAGGSDGLRGVRPDGTPVPMPEVAVRQGGAHRFLPNGAGLVYRARH